MIKQFFFGTSDSPLYMFHHALGSVLILIISFLLITVFINWFFNRNKIKTEYSTQKNVHQDKPVENSEILIQEKPVEKTQELITDLKEEKLVPSLEIDSAISVVTETKQAETEENFDITVFEESACNLKEHLFQFTEILLNKKLSEQDWDKRIPESGLLDHRSYHQLIFLLINLNEEIVQTTSRFKLVLETSMEVAINHQIYFRNWMMSNEMLASFKSENENSSGKKEIFIVAKIAEKKNWKLQASSSEQGTMINLLMKLSLPV